MEIFFAIFRLERWFPAPARLPTAVSSRCATEQLCNDGEECRGHSLINDSLCGNQSGDFGSDAETPMADDDLRDGQDFSGRMMPVEYESEMEDSQYFFSQENKERGCRADSERQRSDARPTDDHLEQVAATRQMSSQAKDTNWNDETDDSLSPSCCDFDEQWRIETRVRSETESHRESD